MTDFVQTMKDWRRMCRYYSDEIVKNVQLSCIDICPLGHNITCDAIEDALDSDIEDAARAIAQWAEKHPEPISDVGNVFSRQDDKGYAKGKNA